MNLSEGQKATILKYLLTGASLGIGTNLALNMASYLRDKSDTVEDKEKLKNSVKGNTQVYEIDPSELEFLQKSASEFEKPGLLNNTLAQALAIVSAAGGAYGGYKLADMFHDKIKNDDLSQEEKAEAENYFKKLYLLQQAQKKTASDMTKEAKLSDWIGTGLGLILLTSIGSGLLTRSIMKKNYPMLSTSKIIDNNPNLITAPKKVVIVEKDPVAEVKVNESVGLDSDAPTNTDRDPNEASVEDENDAFSKAFSKYSFDKSEPYCNEALLKLCYNMEKEGKIGSITNLVKSASAGFTKELKSVIEKPYEKSFTVFDMADSLVDKFYTKEASSPEKEQIALTWLASSPEISKAIMPQAAAEFANNAPTFYKLSSYIPESAEPVFASILSSVVVNDRCNTFKNIASNLKDDSLSLKEASVKYASSNLTFTEGLEAILNDVASDTNASAKILKALS